MPLFSPTDLRLLRESFRIETLYEWVKQKKVIKLRNDVYIFPDMDLGNNKIFQVANKLYTPSYISLEQALSYYSLIPEGVFQITSVTTKRKATFQTELGSFTYKTLKPQLFFGYQIVVENGYTYKIATIEKAILDYLYLNKIEGAEYFEGLRLNREIVKKELNFTDIEKTSRTYRIKGVDKKLNLLKLYLK